MVAEYARSLLDGLGDFFTVVRDMFDCLPMSVQALIYFGFGGIMLLCILHLIFIRG